MLRQKHAPFKFKLVDKPDLAADEAAHMLASLAASAEDFAWHMVDKAIGNVRNHDRRLWEPNTTV